jgi:putative Mn2+ efflux pump MntP
MDWSFGFFFASVCLGIGLAMDAFSVSLANGLKEVGMRGRRMCLMAGVFAFFQAFMPFIGWVCVHTIVQYFHAFQKFIPWIALILLCFIGGKMLIEGIRTKCEDGVCDFTRTTFAALLVQGVATSIDALSVGFQIANYNLAQAVVCALLIAAVTFVICLGGLAIGKKFGTSLSNKAAILGGCILIAIGIWIFIKGMIG